MESRVPYNATGSVGPEPPPNSILIQLLPLPPCGNDGQSMPIAVQAIPLYLGHKGSIPQAPGNRWRQEMSACPSRRQPTIPYYSSTGSSRTSTYSDINGSQYSQYSGQGNLAQVPKIRAYQINYPPKACCCPPSAPQANIYGNTSSYSQHRPSNQPHNPPLREDQIRSCDCFNEVRNEEIRCKAFTELFKEPISKEAPKYEAKQEDHRDQFLRTNNMANGLPDFDTLKIICDSLGKAMMAAAMAAVDAIQKSQQPTGSPKNLDDGQAGMQFPEPQKRVKPKSVFWDSNTVNKSEALDDGLKTLDNRPTNKAGPLNVEPTKEEQTGNYKDPSDIDKGTPDGENQKGDLELDEKQLDADTVGENKLMNGEHRQGTTNAKETEENRQDTQENHRVASGSMGGCVKGVKIVRFCLRPNQKKPSSKKSSVAQSCFTKISKYLKKKNTAPLESTTARSTQFNDP